MYFILTYFTVPDYTERRMPFRQAHLEHVAGFYDRGMVLMGGALSDPADKAIIIFRCSSADLVHDFARHDPYVKNGVVSSWEVRPWNVVIGQQ